MAEQPEAGALAGLGLGSSEERILSLLVRQPGLDRREIAEAVGEAGTDTRRALARMERLGLVTRSGGRSPRFSAVPPELGLETLIVRHQEALDLARIATRGLQERFEETAQHEGTRSLVEVVSGRDAVADRVQQLEQMTRHELRDLSKPPYAVAPGKQTPLIAALQRGVKYRVIYEGSALEFPGVSQEMAELQREGMDARFHPHLPFKLLIGDRRFGMLPLRLEEPGTVEGAVFVQSSSLLDALVVLWEGLWRRATPLGLTERPGSELTEEDRTLAALLLAGLKGNAIARRLDVSLSTADRRIQQLIEKLDSNNRVQAGFMLAQRHGFPAEANEDDGRRSPDPA